MRTHRLKTWPEFFEAIKSKAKTFEVRRDDRGFMVGDLLELQEWDPSGLAGCDGYTSRVLKLEITYKLPGGKFGVSPDFCVLGFKPV